MSVGRTLHGRRIAIGGTILALVLVAALAPTAGLPLAEVLTVGAFERTLRAAAPIALAAIGGLYAEKSGVFNIGLEGFLIFGAFVAAAVAWVVSGGSEISQADLWIGVLGAVLACTVLGILFAILLVRYQANQIVAGLAVWFIALGFAPFSASVIWGGVSSPPLPNINTVAVPLLADIPFLGPVLFDVSPLVLGTLLLAVAAWIGLNRTRVGYWIQAAGENPEALETAGVDVLRVRYAAVILSAALCGLGGAALSIGFAGGFTGSGTTMVNGRGWIAITAYLFANYNPLGTLGAAILFGGANALQIQLQTVGIEVSGTLTGLIPYVAVLVVLVLVGQTRMPAAVGDPYDPDE